MTSASAGPRNNAARAFPLLANNFRLLILPGCDYPNLISRFMKLMLAQLSEDWQRRWWHPLADAETFVDPVCSLSLEELQAQGIALAQPGLLGGWEPAAPLPDITLREDASRVRTSECLRLVKFKRRVLAPGRRL